MSDFWRTERSLHPRKWTKSMTYRPWRWRIVNKVTLSWAIQHLILEVVIQLIAEQNRPVRSSLTNIENFAEFESKVRTFRQFVLPFEVSFVRVLQGQTKTHKYNVTAADRFEFRYAVLPLFSSFSSLPDRFVIELVNISYRRLSLFLKTAPFPVLVSIRHWIDADFRRQCANSFKVNTDRISPRRPCIYQLAYPD